MSARKFTSGMLAALFCLSGAGSADAQSTARYLQISAGTGFLVNRAGDVVTNAHVVKACQSIAIRTDRGEIPAELVASDAGRDLAVLHVPTDREMTVAPLRWNISDLKIGDSVIVMGYPGMAGVEGRYRFSKTSVTSLSGPTGELQWIQLASVAEHGNSGGPVLDSTGNVIAVVSGLAMTYRVDQDGRRSPALIGQSDVAITLQALQEFLQQNNIEFTQESSGMLAYSDGVIESNAHRFIVPVHCVQGVVPRPGL